MKQKISVWILLILWGGLVLGCWFGPREAVSDAERRPLAQMPELTLDTLLDGSFMEDFESFSLDQFPMRDGFRKLKSLFHYYGLNQSDNNGIYLAEGSAAAQEYPLEESSLRHALERFAYIYDTYLKDSGGKIYSAVVPDKGYYLAEESGHLAMDYEALFSGMEEGMPWAEHIDLTDTLSAGDYYRTDTHWRQENLIPAAQRISQALGVAGPEAEDYTVTALDRPFYGVYYGQAALPMEPDSICLMENATLDGCTVYDYETGKTGDVYDESKLTSKDLYDVYLSGARALLTIENPNASTDRELVIFRDSFGSAMAPLLVGDYAKVTLVDLRYISGSLLGEYLEFDDQDVLFLFSTLVLNNSASLK